MGYLNPQTGYERQGIGVHAAEVTYEETTDAGVYTGSVTLPAGATLLDIIVTADALWDTTTSATLKIGDADDDDGYFAGVNLKATDLLAGESISFAQAGGKGGAYVSATHANKRHSAAARTISGVVTTVGAAGDAGRTRMAVVYATSAGNSAAVKE